MKKILTTIICSMLVMQAALMMILSLNMSQGGHVFYGAYTWSIYLPDYEPLVQCDFPEKPTFVPIELWDPGPPKCHLNPLLLASSFLMGSAGAIGLYYIVSTKRKKKS